MKDGTEWYASVGLWPRQDLVKSFLPSVTFVVSQIACAYICGSSSVLLFLGLIALGRVLIPAPLSGLLLQSQHYLGKEPSIYDTKSYRSSFQVEQGGTQ